MPNEKPATLSDVAREAGVSPYTVSGVLNGARTNTRVSPATRERILASATRLRYQPNAQARNLARQCTRTIGVLFDFIRSVELLTSPYSAAVLQGIVTEAARLGYDILLYTEHREGGPLPLDRFRDRRTDGIIVVAPLTDEAVMAELSTMQIPLVAVSAAPGYGADGKFATVDVDNAGGIEMAVAHLVALGHRRIAHLTGNQNMYSTQLRGEAFTHAVQQNGLPAEDAFVITCAYNGTLAREALDTLLALPHPPTAIVAGNDNIAFALLEAARRRGVAVPHALSVVGFDDTAAASHVTPKLTTVRQPLTEIGAMATRLLVERIGPPGSDAPARPKDFSHLLAPELIVRDSTAAPSPSTT